MRKAFCALILAALAQPASADIFTFNFFLSGDQEFPAKETDAVGITSMAYDDDDQEFDIAISVFGIVVEDLLGAGPNDTPVQIQMALPGQNGPTVIDLGFVAQFENYGEGMSLMAENVPIGGGFGGFEDMTEQNEAALFAGELYVNIFTKEFPTGELRGQVINIPAPGVAGTLAALGAAAALRRRRR